MGDDGAVFFVGAIAQVVAFEDVFVGVDNGLRDEGEVEGLVYDFAFFGDGVEDEVEARAVFEIARAGVAVVDEYFGFLVFGEGGDAEGGVRSLYSGLA